jgi:hypothetical protein
MDNKVHNVVRLRDALGYAVQRGKGIPIRSDLSEFNEILKQIRNFDFTGDSDKTLRSTAAAIRRQITTAVHAACLNTMTGRGVHILTANDYPAGRDAEWMREIYRFFGFTVQSVSEKTSPGERRKAYAADITYLAAKQCGFDFLRDRLQYEKENIVQRPFSFAVIDEADFIMIDEARVPMVIAADYPSGGIDPSRVDKAVRTLVPARHYTVGRAGRSIWLLSGTSGKVFTCSAMAGKSRFWSLSGWPWKISKTAWSSSSKKGPSLFCSG